MMDAIIVFLAVYLIFAVALVAGLVGYMTKKRREFLIASILAFFIAMILALIADSLFYNPRPFVAHNIKPLFPHDPDNGFPSMHTVLAMTLTAVIYFYNRHLAAAAFILSVLVGAGRVWAHVHSWIDIFAGLVIGAAAGYAGVILARYLITKSGPIQKSVSERKK